MCMFIYIIILYFWFLFDCVIRFCFDFFGYSGEELIIFFFIVVYGVLMVGFVEIFLYEI